MIPAAGPIVVEFMSYGCAHCRVIEPVLQKVAKMLESKEKIFRLNIAADEELANTYDIQSTPTLVSFPPARRMKSKTASYPSMFSSSCSCKKAMIRRWPLSSGAN